MKGRAVMFMGARKPFEITEYDVPMWADRHPALTRSMLIP